MTVTSVDKYQPTLSLWKFVIPSDSTLSVDGTLHFPAVAIAVAESESQALLILLKYCQKEGFVRCRDWEWLFYCDVEQLPVTPSVSCFVAL